MKRIITLTALVLGLTGGIAAADRGRDGWVRDHRDGDRWDRRDRGWDNRWDRRARWDRLDRRDRVVRVERVRPWFRDNRWYFHGGTYRQYHRPVINVRYRDYYRRPALVVENYDPVPGYIWVQGNWNWNGYEWIWVSGRYEIDTNYNDGYYNGGHCGDGHCDDYDYNNGYNSGYNNSYNSGYYSPGVSGGVTIGGSVRF